MTTRSKCESRIGAPAGARITRWTIPAVLFLAWAGWAQAQDTQQNSSGETTTTQTSIENTNPSRTVESHYKSGNQTVDKQSLQVLGTDGRYRPYSDTETETVRVDDNTTRTVVRTYYWDGNGQRNLAGVTEAETQTAANGDAHTVRTTSHADLNGHLQAAQREVEDTRKTSPDSQETKTNFYVGDGSGGFTASGQTLEVQKTGPDKTTEVTKTALGPDANGGWLVNEVREKTVKEGEKSQTTEEQVSRPDLNGKLSVISREVDAQTQTPDGETRSTVEKYSVDGPGVTRDGSMRLSRRVTSVQKKDSNGDTSEEQVKEPNPGNPSDPPRVTAKTKYTVLYGSSGAQETKTVEAPDGSGTFKPVEVQKEKTNETPPAQAPAAPANNPQ
jgi:hypothetical protein